MIEIQNEKGQYLYLYQDSVIENELNSWLMSGDELLGSFSVPFRFPVARNESFLSHKHRPEAGGFTGVKVTVAVDGMPLGAGNLTFRVDNNACDGILNFNASDVATKLRSKYVHDAVIEDAYTMCSSHADLPGAMLRTVDPLTNPWPFCFFPVYNDEFCDKDYDSSGFSYRKYVNAYSYFPTGRFVPDTATTYGSPVVPFFYFTHVIRRICDYLGYTPEGAWLDDPGIRALVMYNDVAMDTSGLFASFTVFTRFHVWQMKLNEFFKLLRDDMGVAVFFDATRQVIVFKTFVEIAQVDVAHDFSAALLKHYVAAPVEQTGISVSFPYDSSDDYSKELPEIPPYVIGLGENEISMRLTTLPTYSTTLGGILDKLAELAGIPAGKWLVPIAKRKGTALGIQYLDMGIYDITFPPKNVGAPRLLSFFGMRKDTSNRSYPYGSSLSRDAQQNRVSSISLIAYEADSLFHTYVRPYLEFKTFSKKITLKFWLKLSAISRLKLWEKVAVGSADMVMLPYIISKLTYALPDMKGKVIAEMELYPLLPPSDDYIAKIPTANIWVKIEFTELDAGGLYPATVVLCSVKFKLYNSRQAETSASSPLPIPIFYQYQLAGHNSLDGSYETELKNDSVIVEPNASEAMIPLPLPFWKSDDKQFQIAYADEQYIVKSSFKLMPAPGYLIV
ncbi:hypothetical protein [Runella zeae]|uniref:hypothetical protein n=1 Tax=Runella zeae TaxID=94255 RepID=UPI002352A747|nr:hypothetical protein [Runella zeae]